MKKRITNTALLICVLSITLALFTATPVHAATTTGQISGQLQDGTNQSAPVASQKVTLQVAQGSNAQDLTSATTDAHGNFSFSNLDTDKTKSYAIYTNYQGAQYTSNVVTLDTNPVQQLTLTVYQAAQNSAKLAITDATALVHEPSLQTSTVTISEIFTFKNLDTHTFVGSLDGSKGKPNALLFSLPAGARQFVADQGFSGYHVIQVDHGFATDAALLPGDNQLSFSFEMPYSTSTLDLSYTTMYPTVRLSVLIPPDLHGSSSTLSAQGLVNSGTDQHAYNLFKAEVLPANKTVSLRLEGLIVPQQANASSLNPGTIWLIVGIVLLLAIILVSVFLLRPERRKRAQKQKGAAQTRKASGTATRSSAKAGTASSNAKAGTASSEERRQELLQQLLELDKSYEAGKLTKAVYEERRGKTKARLRTLMSERETARR